MIKKIDIRSQVIRTEKVAILEIEVNGETQYIDINYSIDNDSDDYWFDSLKIDGKRVNKLRVVDVLEKRTGYTFNDKEVENMNDWLDEVLRKYDIKEEE